MTKKELLEEAVEFAKRLSREKGISLLEAILVVELEQINDSLQDI